MRRSGASSDGVRLCTQLGTSTDHRGSKPREWPEDALRRFAGRLARCLAGVSAAIRFRRVDPGVWIRGVPVSRGRPDRCRSARCILTRRRRRSEPQAGLVGRGGFEPPKAYATRFTVWPSWPLWYLPLISRTRRVQWNERDVSGAISMLGADAAPPRASSRVGRQAAPVSSEGCLVSSEQRELALARPQCPRSRGATPDGRDPSRVRVRSPRARAPRWSQRWGSNPQPPDYKSGALPLSYAGPRG